MICFRRSYKADFVGIASECQRTPESVEPPTGEHVDPIVIDIGTQVAGPKRVTNETGRYRIDRDPPRMCAIEKPFIGRDRTYPARPVYRSQRMLRCEMPLSIALRREIGCESVGGRAFGRPTDILPFDDPAASLKSGFLDEDFGYTRVLFPL